MERLKALMSSLAIVVAVVLATGAQVPLRI